MKIKCLPILGLLLALQSSTHAAIHTWSGSGANGNWSNPANWSSGGSPSAGEANCELRFDSQSAVNTQPVIDVSGVVVSYLFIWGKSYTFSAVGGARLHLASSLVDISAPTTFDSSVEIAQSGTNVFEIDAALYVGGKISGSGSLMFGYESNYDSPSPVWFSGSVGNTYSGYTEVWPGVQLMLNKSAGNAIPGQLRVLDLYTGGGWGIWAKDTIYNGIVKLFRDDQIADGAQIILEGILDLNNHTDTTGPLRLANDGRVTTGAGTLILNGPVTKVGLGLDEDGFIYYDFHSRIDGNLALGSPADFTTGRVFDIDDSHWIELNARVSGFNTARLRKQGLGELRLAGTNNYAGVTFVDAGTLRVDSDVALGGTGAGTTVNPGAQLLIADGAAVGLEPLTLNGGVLAAKNAPNSWAGPITLQTNSVVDVQTDSSSLELSGVIGGPGALTKTGAGSLELAGTVGNGYTGGTFVNAGRLELDKFALAGNPPAIPGDLTLGNATVFWARSNQVVNASSVILNPGSTLDLNGYSDTIGSLTGANGLVDLANGELTIGGNTNSTSVAAVISGAGGRLRKIGPAMLTLVGTNSYSGATTVEGGALIINGSQLNSAITVKSNATLAGSGLLGTATAQSGIVSPGNSVGRMNSKSVLWDSTSVFHVQLNGLLPASGYDQLNVNGTVNLGGAILEATLGISSPTNWQFTIIANDSADAVLGTFADLPEGQFFYINSTQFQISYHGGDGNDVVLTQTSTTIAPHVDGIATLPNGNPRINGTGIPLHLYLVERSEDLQNWMVLNTVAASGAGVIQYEDADGFSLPRAFYRFLAVEDSGQP